MIFFRNGMEYRKGKRFYFKAFTGWTSQYFYNFNAERPDPALFEIPKSCQVADIKNCGYL